MIIEKNQKLTPAVVEFILDQWVENIYVYPLIGIQGCVCLNKKKKGRILFDVYINEFDILAEQVETFIHEIIHIFSALSGRRMREKSVEKRTRDFVMDNFEFCVGFFARACPKMHFGFPEVESSTAFRDAKIKSCEGTLAVTFAESRLCRGQ